MDQGQTKESCQKMVQWALDNNSFVRFMVEHLEKAGCKVDKEFFRVEQCNSQVGGGFRPPDGVSTQLVPKFYRGSNPVGFLGAKHVWHGC